MGPRSSIGGWRGFCLSILIGVTAAAMVVALVGSGAGVDAAPARTVSAYSLHKVLQVEGSGAAAAPVVESIPSSVERFDYSQYKVNQVKGETSVLTRNRPHLANLIE